MMSKKFSLMRNNNLIKTAKESEVVLGIDPGYDRLGICIIKKNSNNKEELLYSHCLQTSSKSDIYTRMFEISEFVTKIIKEYEPDSLAIETLFITKNQKTAMRVSEVRGIIINEAMKNNMGIYEFSPMEIKMAITGDGSSDKARIKKMLELLIEIKNKKALDDEYDAIAVALTRLSTGRLYCKK